MMMHCFLYCHGQRPERVIMSTKEKEKTLIAKQEMKSIQCNGYSGRKCFRTTLVGY